MSQHYPDLEYILLDGGSRDGSVELIKRYDSDLSFWRSGPDDGPYQAINEGFKLASGDVLCWLNSDDLLFPGSLHYIGCVFGACDNVQWLTSISLGEANMFGDFSSTLIPGIGRESFLAGRHIPTTGKRFLGFIQQESTFFRSSLWTKSKGIPCEYPLAGDFALWSNFFNHSEVHLTTTLLGAFRSHETNRSKDINKYISEAKKILDNYRQENSWNSRCSREFIANTRLSRFGMVQKRFGYNGLRLVREFEGPLFAWREIPFRYL